jgi:hypothetical protein
MTGTTSTGFHTTVDTSMFDDIITDELIGFEGGNTAYQVPGESIAIKAGEYWVSREKVQIGDALHEFNVRTRFINPILSSMALRITNARTMEGRRDFTGTVVAERELQVMIGDEWVDIVDIALGVLRKGNPGLSHRSDTDILLDLKNYGFEPRGRLPMFLQHLGSNDKGFMEAAEHFVALGAKDNTAQVATRSQGKLSRVQASFRHDEGVPINTLEISRVDRTKSMNNTGFIGFLDATWNTFMKAVDYDKRRTAIRHILAEDVTNKEAAQQEAEIRDRFSQPNLLRAFRNWGGTTTVVDPIDDDKIRHFPQQVPCGRLSVHDTRFNGTDVVNYNVWSVKTANPEHQSEQVPTAEGLQNNPPEEGGDNQQY